MSADRFIERLEALAILDPRVIASLRRQVREAKRPINAKAVANLLVGKGHLTPFQANQLLEQVETETNAGSAAGDDLDLAPLDDDLGLAPLDDEAAPKSTSPKSTAPTSEPKGTPHSAPAKAPGGTPPVGGGVEGGKGSVPKLETVGLDPLADLLTEELGSDPLADDPLASAAAAEGRGGPLAGATSKKKQARWDSPLILVGGGALVVLVLLGGLLLFALTRGSSQEAFELAEEQYRNQAYPQAISLYDKFLSRFEGAPETSLARVRRGMAELRMAVDVEKNMPRALETAERVLPTIVNESQFEEARAELASLLPTIAEHFALTARQAVEPEPRIAAVEQADRVLRLIDDGAYLPSSRREAVQHRLTALEENLAAARRQMQQQRALEQAVHEIGEAAEANEFSRAYERHASLLAEYPALAADAALQQAVRGLSEQLAAQVSVETPAAAAAPEAEPLPPRPRILWHVEGNIAAAGEPFPLQAEEYVLGYRPGDGAILWRYYHGDGQLGVVARAAAGGPAVVLDGVRRRLVGLDPSTGLVKWQQPLPALDRAGLPLSPTSLGGEVLLPFRGGSLRRYDAASGELLLAAQLPQGIGAPPGFAAEGNGPLYLPGDHTNLFVIDRDTFAGREVFHLGHVAGAVAIPPVVLRGFVLVVENGPTDYCRLHVLKADGAGLGLAPAQQPFRLPGRAITPISVSGGRAALVTDLGAVTVVEVDPAEATTPCRVVGKTAPAGSPSPAWALLVNDDLWIADRRLTRYRVEAARQQLPRGWAREEGGAFFGPPVASAAGVTALYRAAAGPHWVCAVYGGDFANAVVARQSHLAGAPLAVVAAEQGAMEVATSEGALWRITDDEPAALIAGPPAGSAPRLGGAAKLPGGEWWFHSSLPSTEFFAYASGAKSLVLLDTPLPKDSLAAPPTRLAGLFTAASRSGPVFTLQGADGRPAVSPFQPPLAPGEEVEWLQPQFVISGKNHLLLATAKGKLYRLSLVFSQPRQWKVEVEGDLAGKPRNAPIGLGDRAFAVLVRDGAREELVWIAHEDFTELAREAMQEPVTWGPYIAPMGLVVGLHSGAIEAWNGEGRRVWRSDPSAEAPFSPLGPPAIAGESVILAGIDGRVIVIDPEGESRTLAQFGEPVRQVEVVGSRLHAFTRDGGMFSLPWEEPSP